MTTVLGIPQISQELLDDIDRVGRRYERWTVPAYLELTGNYLVEFVRGRLEILPMPTMRHQVLASRMYDAVRAAAPPGSLVLFAGTRVKVTEETFREPDVLYIPPESRAASPNEYATGVTLVVEVVSESNRDHDFQTKRAEYASAGIPEYWIVDPDERQVTVLTLRGDGYATHGLFEDGAEATSLLLLTLKVDVATLFAD